MSVEFNYYLNAIDNKTNYDYVYGIYNHNKMVISHFFNLPRITAKDGFSLDSLFGLYVSEHFNDILSAKDNKAKLSCLIVDHDFSLTLAISAKTKKSFHLDDSYIEIMVEPTQKSAFLYFGLSVFDKHNSISEYYNIEYIDADRKKFCITEYINDGSKDSKNWPRKRFLVFNKEDYPKIRITDFLPFLSPT